MTVIEQKRILRNKIKILENTLPANYKTESSIKMCSQIQNLNEYKSAKIIFCFVGVKNEPDTSYFLRSALQGGKRLCVPLCISKGIMELHEIKSPDELKKGKYGIPEPPTDSPVICADNLDFAVIPCLTCDKYGNRLGKGGGFYDRFLETYRKSSVLLCFSRLIQQSIPTEPHDCTVNRVITEKGLYINGILQ